MNKEPVTVNYLQMMAASDLAAARPVEGLSIVEAEIPQYQYNRFLYDLVGADWQWNEKRHWTAAQWQAYAEREELRTWTGYIKGSIAGYFELEQQPHDTIELKYFGLAPKSIGKGIGGALLTQAITTAWNWNSPTRVWLHTCSLDHPHALANYQARGFTLYKSEVE